MKQSAEWDNEISKGRRLQVTSVKKQIHDVGTKVYLHTYNNEKRERERFIKKKKKKKKKSRVSNPQPAW